MLDLNELNQLVEFADLGTLSKVAEQEHISTPSLTRSMKHLEESFGVPPGHERAKNQRRGRKQPVLCEAAKRDKIKTIYF